MPHATPTGRITPRWYVGGHCALSPASIAGLPGSKPMVRVGPPLSARGPSFGSVLFRLPGAEKAALASEQMLCPASLITPRQLLVESEFPTMLFTKMVRA